MRLGVLQTNPTSDEWAGRSALPPGLRCDPTSQPWRRCAPCLGPDAAGARQSLVALGLNSSTSLVAGAFLGAITPTLAKYPGLLVLVPAAIGLRGNIFGAFGNRLSTAIHAGTFRWSLRREAVLGQNVLASMLLTMGISLALAVVAKAVAVGSA